MNTNKMTICLWFDNEAEEAAKFYTSIFKNSEMGAVSRFGKEGFEFHGKPEGTAMVANFRLNEMNFMALNGGPNFTFNESVSIVVNCKNQDEIDYYWDSLTEGGEESMCGWLKDRYGVSWQIIPEILEELMSDPKKAPAVTNAFLQMRKFDIETLLKA